MQTANKDVLCCFRLIAIATVVNEENSSSDNPMNTMNTGGWRENRTGRGRERERERGSFAPYSTEGISSIVGIVVSGFVVVWKLTSYENEKNFLLENYFYRGYMLTAPDFNSYMFCLITKSI